MKMSNETMKAGASNHHRPPTSDEGHKLRWGSPTSPVCVEIPDDILRKAREIAGSRGLSVDDFIVLALVQKLSAMIPDAYLEERAKCGDRKKFEAAMAGVPHVSPEDYDRLE